MKALLRIPGLALLCWSLSGVASAQVKGDASVMVEILPDMAAAPGARVVT
jgi:hypothetical protein